MKSDGFEGGNHIHDALLVLKRAISESTEDVNLLVSQFLSVCVCVCVYDGSGEEYASHFEHFRAFQSVRTQG